MKNSRLNILLKNTPKSYYWIGFLLADGSFVENRIKMQLAERDEIQSQKFLKFIKYSGRKKTNCISVMDSVVVPKIMRKFNIKKQKTYFPPAVNRINVKNNNLFLSLCIGFIDGDGSIVRVFRRKDCSLRIKCHSSWLPILQMMSNRICNLCELPPNMAKINNQGYAQIIFSNAVILKFLKKKAKKLNLPILTRKWIRINENYINKTEKAQYHKKGVKELLERGYRRKDIAKKFGLNVNTITMIIRRNKIEVS